MSDQLTIGGSRPPGDAVLDAYVATNGELRVVANGDTRAASPVDSVDRPVEPLRIAMAPGRGGLFMKRLVDIAGASVGLVLLAPLFAITAGLIAIIDGRPVLFRQQRAGRDARPFRIVKFRTMGRDADAQRDALRLFNEVSGGASFKMTDDPRITRLGRVLRKTSIDELPQLWNVLLGEMSLVGPRPHPFDDVAGYRPWHHNRFAMKPGITGLWQVSSRRETDFDRWVELDIQYIREWSLATDIEIIARTIPALLRADGR